MRGTTFATCRPSLRFTKAAGVCVRCKGRATEGRPTEAKPLASKDGSPSDSGSSGDDELPPDASLVQKLGKLAADAAVNPLSYLLAGLVAVQLVQLSGEQDAVVFVLAAFPVVGLTALARSPVGEQVAARLQESLPELDREAAEMRSNWAAARERSPFFGPSRPQLPAALGGAAPHLVGELPGDYGFDPLGFAAEQDKLKWNLEAELLHSRWAMLAVVGCLVPEVLEAAGLNLGEAVWWKVGAAKVQGDIAINWGGIEGFRIAGNQGIWLIIACQLLLMGGPEYARSVGIDSLQPVGVHLPGDQSYPGGSPFDPVGVSKNPDAFLDQQLKEIKNGRLAMVAMLGFAAQAAVTRVGPLQNMLDFIEDPVHNNLFKYLH